MSPQANAHTSERSLSEVSSSRAPNPRAPARSASSTKPLSPMLAKIMTRVLGLSSQIFLTTSAQGTPCMVAPIMTTEGSSLSVSMRASSSV